MDPLTTPQIDPDAGPPADAVADPGDGRPPHIPAKFWDPKTRQIRVDALLKSYLELEKKLTRMVPAPDPDAGPEERARLAAALGRPDRPEDYHIACPHGLFAPDGEVNRRLHAAGLTNDQAQAVYDLAAERMAPIVREVAARMNAERELQRLVEHFGGEDRWQEISRQMLAWAERNLPEDAVEGLASSADGVLALYRMMTGKEPTALTPAGDAQAAEERDLFAMMRDPRYWRDKDPAFVDQVTEGFRRLYGEDQGAS
jgi:hypothetical protein